MSVPKRALPKKATKRKAVRQAASPQAESDKIRLKAAQLIADLYIAPNGSSPKPLTSQDLVDAPKHVEAYEALTNPKTRYIPKMPTIEALKASLGRPPKYHPSMCQVVIEDAENGHTLGATCALLCISRETMDRWINETYPNGDRVYPDFYEAVARAIVVRQRYWETHAVEMSRNGGDSARFQAVKMGLLSVARTDWRDKVDDSKAALNVTFSFADIIKQSMKTIDGTVAASHALPKPTSDSAD